MLAGEDKTRTKMSVPDSPSHLSSEAAEAAFSDPGGPNPGCDRRADGSTAAAAADKTPPRFVFVSWVSIGRQRPPRPRQFS